MIELPALPGLFNPVTADRLLSRSELLAGPMGLIAFVPAVPLVLLLARRWPRAAIVAPALVWLALTLRPVSTGVLLAYLSAGLAVNLALGALRRRDVLGRRAMIALVWLLQAALVLPLWWWPHPDWYPSRMAPLHAAGFAYFLLRFIGWGVDWASRPELPLRLADTWAWLMYPACMRLGPVMSREVFFERLARWEPRRSDVAGGLRRFVLCLLGAAGLALVGQFTPRVAAGQQDFFAAPASYGTAQLAAAFYLVPIQVYLLLWTYNELAAAVGRWVGIPVDNNFDWLPRSTSVREFWRRWHITVGAWLRTYIYIPLGGNRRSALATYPVVFGFCGLWHGASWSFLAWGLSQAAALAVQRRWDAVRAGLLLRAPGLLRLRPAGVAVAWLLTMHYQAATVLVFTDFQHFGTRLIPELLRRLSGA